MRRLLGLLAMVLLVTLLGAPMAVPSYASCADASGPDGSPVIFVGSAQEERRGFTRFEVDEVWAGPDLADEVWVLSGQEQAPFPLYVFSSVASSTDAEFDDGESYVVGASEEFATGACSVAEPGADLGSLRPDDPRSPVSDGATGVDPPIGPWASGLILGGAVALLGGLAVAVKRRHGARRL